jgi:hypothetical protein
MRHDKVCAPLCFSVFEAPNIEMTDKWYTLLPKPAYEQEVVTVLWNQAVHTDREVTASRQDIIIKNKKRKNMYTDRCGNAHRQKCGAKGSRKEGKIQEFMYRETTNAGLEMHDYTSNNWSYQNCNNRFKEKFRSHTRKTVNTFTTKDSCTWNVTHNMESAAV